MKKVWEKYSYTMILIATSMILTAVFASELKDENEGYITVTVNEGASLWEIAEELSDKHNFTKQEFIAWVEEENGIQAGMIYAGEELVVPISAAMQEPTMQIASINLE